MLPQNIPSFRPPLWLVNGHMQTCSLMWAGRSVPEDDQRVKHVVPVSHGDEIVVHDDKPVNWQAGHRCVLMIHGLAGSHRSGYMPRVARKLNGAGFRTFRMDLRTCGAGVGRARRGYHGGLTEDALRALELIQETAPQSLITVVGFSLGGNIVLKLLGDGKFELPAWLDSSIAICPPLDLSDAVRSLQHSIRRLYDRHFVKLLLRQVKRNWELSKNPEPWPFDRDEPKTLYEFDDRFTAKQWEFGTAEDYYEANSCGRVVSEIKIPTTVLASRDDPIIPVRQHDLARWSAKVRVVLTSHGGHMGFRAGATDDPDKEWMEWRIVDWVKEYDGLARQG